VSENVENENSQIDAHGQIWLNLRKWSFGNCT